jgi:hypothetical protein
MSAKYLGNAHFAFSPARLSIRDIKGKALIEAS